MPDFSETSAYYQSRSPVEQADIIEACLPRSPFASNRDECEEPSFSLSLEFFNEILRMFVNES